MEWSDEDVGCAWQEWRSTPTRDMDDALRRVMSLAISIKAASKRPLTREQVRYLCDVVREHESKDAGDLLAEYIDILGATVATLQAKVEELERQRDVARGLAATNQEHLVECVGERDILRAKVADLEGRLATEEAERIRCRDGWATASAEVARLTQNLNALRREQEECEDREKDQRQRAEAAVSSLAAIRERASHANDPLAQWVLEGDAAQEAGGHINCGPSCPGYLNSGHTHAAPNSPGSPDGSGGEPQEAPTVLNTCICQDGTTELCLASRHPCSATCTHDDARTPGHPERVKERSEAVKAALKTCPLCKGKGTAVDIDQWPKPTRATPTTCMACDGSGMVEEEPEEDVGRRPENDNDTFDSIENGVEGAMPITRTQLERYADKKAEAMRAACWEAVQRVAQTLALGPTEQEMLKAAIEGATP